MFKKRGKTKDAKEKIEVDFQVESLDLNMEE